jgi:C4-dicarboxylate-specific signal transduction histidine kinase
MLLWLSARCRPVFAAAAAFLVSITVVSTTVFGIGHFGDIELPIDERILQAQTTILFVALCAFVLAALFAERRESEAWLALSNMMLERERDNKLLNIQAVIASIAHEISQPLTAIAAHTGAARRFLKNIPPNYDQAVASLSNIVNAIQRTTEVFQGLRTLFGKPDQNPMPVDVNEMIQAVLESLHAKLRNHRVVTRVELTANLPLADGHPGQLQEVALNLVNNAIEAMDSTPPRNRILRVHTGLRSDHEIAISVQDTGPGIHPEQMKSIFGAFVTTKASGTGLGLAICRMIVENHGGQLTVTSDGKSGAQFQFVLPITPTEKKSARCKGARP